MGFSLEEYRAGHSRVRQEVEAAEAELARARGHRERREARRALEQARSALDASSAMLEQAEKQARILAANGPSTSTAATASGSRPERERTAPAASDHMSMSEAMSNLRNFGGARRAQGDEFLEAEFIDGAFFYESGETRIGVVVWGEEDDWAISIFSAARVNMWPTLENHRLVARSRAAEPLGAPYFAQVDVDGSGAILCERSFQSAQLADDTTARRMIFSTIDLIGVSAQNIARTLDDSNGVPFTASGQAGLMTLLTWWEGSDDEDDDDDALGAS